MKARALLSAIRFALPDGVLDNERLAGQYPGWSAEKIYTKTGIRERRVAGAGETASDLAVAAAEKLFRETGYDRKSVDYLLYCTQTPDFPLPATACLVQERLGLPQGCGALDFNLGCSGYIYGLGLAKGLIETAQASSILLVTADTYSAFIHPADKSTRTLFGDAAAATLLLASGEESLVGPFVYGTDGSGAHNLIVPTGGARRPRVPGAEAVEDASGNARTVNDLYLNGPEILTFTLRVVPATVQRLLEESGVALADIDLFVFHQANRFMLDHLKRKLSLPTEKFVLALEETGNTVSSSIPIALCKAIGADRVTPGDLLMLVGFGVGYSWGGTLVRWHGEAHASR
jgi:3-oxoacyl-[acyl-carrier-protein] synthase-3